MCCCGQPTINGQPGYRWSNPNDPPGIRPISAPALYGGDALLFDEPGRCGGLDAHSHHFRVVLNGRTLYLLTRHGGGDERVRLSGTQMVIDALNRLDSTGRYWMLHALHHAQAEARRKGQEETTARWRDAAAKNRIKVRKVRGTDCVRVELLAEV